MQIHAEQQEAMQRAAQERRDQRMKDQGYYLDLPNDYESPFRSADEEKRSAGTDIVYTTLIPSGRSTRCQKLRFLR